MNTTRHSQMESRTTRPLEEKNHYLRMIHAGRHSRAYLRNQPNECFRHRFSSSHIHSQHPIAKANAENYHLRYILHAHGIMCHSRAKIAFGNTLYPSLAPLQMD